MFPVNIPQKRFFSSEDLSRFFLNHTTDKTNFLPSCFFVHSQGLNVTVSLLSRFKVKRALGKKKKKGCQTVFQLVVTSLSIWSIIHDVNKSADHRLWSSSRLWSTIFFPVSPYFLSHLHFCLCWYLPPVVTSGTSSGATKGKVCVHVCLLVRVCVFCFINYHYFDFCCHCAGGSSCAEVCRGGLWGVTHTDVLLVFVICFFFFFFFLGSV